MLFLVYSTVPAPASERAVGGQEGADLPSHPSRPLSLFAQVRKFAAEQYAQNGITMHAGHVPKRIVKNADGTLTFTSADKDGSEYTVQVDAVLAATGARLPFIMPACCMYCLRMRRARGWGHSYTLVGSDVSQGARLIASCKSWNALAALDPLPETSLALLMLQAASQRCTTWGWRRRGWRSTPKTVPSRSMSTRRPRYESLVVARWARGRIAFRDLKACWKQIVLGTCSAHGAPLRLTSSSAQCMWRPRRLRANANPGDRRCRASGLWVM